MAPFGGPLPAASRPWGALSPIEFRRRSGADERRPESFGMTRLLELLVAVVMVVVLAVVVSLALPSHGHAERSIEVSHDIRHIYDILNNFRRFPEYAVLRAYDPKMQYTLEGPGYGNGAKIAWTSSDRRVGNGELTIASSQFDPLAGGGQVTWSLDNDWNGTDKTFTLAFKRAENQRLVRITWSYDVDYGWNLLSRLAGLSWDSVHGAPDSLIQYSLNNLQNVLAAIPNVDYSKVAIKIVPTTPQPILFVSTKAARSLEEVDAATGAAVDQINDAMKKMGVGANGPRTTFTTDYGDENYVFDVAVPINTTTVYVDNNGFDLTKLAPPAPAAADQGGDEQAAPTELKPGSTDEKGNLVVDAHVRASMAFGGKALIAEWDGTPAGIPLTRLALKAYALTHGYRFDEVTHRFYDQNITPPDVTAYDEQKFLVYLPVLDAPDQTPEQASGTLPAAPAPASSAPAPASTAPAPASTSAGA